jgi:lipopolysaccharide transport system ATP-binding protein
MSEPIITVRDLGKKYRLRHQASARYVAMRDVLAGLFHGPKSGRGSVRAELAEDFWALRDVSFDIEPGQVVGIIGRNGAGKSTLLKILSQIVEPTTGSVHLYGRVASLLEVGTGFHPELSGRENIFMNGAILGMSRKEIVRKFDEIVAFAEVERFLDTPVKHYSSGMYVRLAFAVAAHLEPEILVVDEVLAVGDADFQKKCLGKMHEVSRGGRTVLFVSHNVSAIASLCDRGIVFDSGSISYDGAVADALALYSSAGTRVIEKLRVVDGPQIENISIDSDAASRGDIRIRLSFESPHVLKNPHLGVVVYSSQGAAVFGYNTDMDPAFEALPVANGGFEFCVPDAPLHSGLYKVTIWFGEKGRRITRVDDAIVFHFVSSSVLPSGVSPDFVGYTRVRGRIAMHV